MKSQAGARETPVSGVVALTSTVCPDFAAPARRGGDADPELAQPVVSASLARIREMAGELVASDLADSELFEDLVQEGCLAAVARSRSHLEVADLDDHDWASVRAQLADLVEAAVSDRQLVGRWVEQVAALDRAERQMMAERGHALKAEELAASLGWQMSELELVACLLEEARQGAATGSDVVADDDLGLDVALAELLSHDGS